MKLPHGFSFQRLRGIIAKEFTQMRRDRLHRCPLGNIEQIPAVILLIFRS